MAYHAVANLSRNLQDAIHNNDVETVNDCLAQEATSGHQDQLNASLILAMPQASKETIELLLKLGAKLQSSSFYNAISRNEPAVFQLLIESGWDINSTEFELPAVQLTLQNEPLLRWLLEHGADPNTMSQRRFPGSCLQRASPLFNAAALPDSGPLEVLLSYGATLDPLAIFYAVSGDRGAPPNGTATLIALIDHGADVNYVSKRWGTPLHYAVRLNQEEKVKLLLNYGADASIKTLQGGGSALDDARKKNLVSFVEIMEAACSNGMP